MHSRAERSFLWLPWLNGDEYHQSYLIMRLFVLQNAAMFVRPNVNKCGFDIKLRTRLGINYYTMGEFYARPGQVPDVEGDIIVADFREPNNDVVQDHGVPIVFVEEPPQQQNDIVVVANPNDIVVIANPEDNVIIANPDDNVVIEDEDVDMVDNNNEFIVVEAGPAEPEQLPENEQIVHNDSGIENNDDE